MIYLVVSVVIFNVVAYFIPKRITKLEMYATSIFALFFANLIDLFLEHKYLLYWYFNKEVDWISLIVFFGTYPAINIMVLNFFPLDARYSKKITYIALWSLFLTFYEWGAVNIGEFLHYGKWNIWYSLLLYPVIVTILYWNFMLIRRLSKSSK
ncbi:CBO0543 family protein [Ammoniphilus sp. 3BR4]|uniref:CBO0543 family protein n=1 Tax=Ammoniphilus sp. 3BR4 TaxID=3158265 RepID=UPI003465BF81